MAEFNLGVYTANTLLGIEKPTVRAEVQLKWVSAVIFDMLHNKTAIDEANLLRLRTYIKEARELILNAELLVNRLIWVTSTLKPGDTVK